MRKAFGIAGGAQEHARNVLVVVETDSGVRGFGEAAPFPAFNGETQEAALAAIERATGELVGRDLSAWRPLAERIADLTKDSASAGCALETATLDALTRALGTSLRVFVGGAESELVTDITITTGTVEEAAREAAAFAAFRTLKIKVGGGDVAEDVARVLAVHAARPDARLMLDGNAGMSEADAIELARELAKKGVVPALFEQPAADLTALASIRDETGLHIALDESVTCPADVVRAHQERAVDVVNVKIMKSGIARALDIVATARACGLGLMIGGMVETRLAMGASAAIAAGLGGFAYIDLDTPLFLAEDPFDGGYAQDDERLDLRAVTSGLGTVPRARLT